MPTKKLHSVDNVHHVQTPTTGDALDQQTPCGLEVPLDDTIDFHVP